jgi:ABC-type antimicrobial peptide transport system permease subunit
VEIATAKGTSMTSGAKDFFRLFLCPSKREIASQPASIPCMKIIQSTTPGSGRGTPWIVCSRICSSRKRTIGIDAFCNPPFDALTVVRNADPALPIAYSRTLDEQVSRSLNAERMLAALSVAFGTLALLLSLVGLYGVMSFVVTQRTREIGIRLALGATRTSAIWLVLRDALAMIFAGTAVALPCVWALGRFVESQLFGVKPTDPSAIAAATLLLTSAALVAALIPARRASAVNPTEALRFE